MTVEALLAREIGLNADSIGLKSIELAVRGRMQACHISEPTEYLGRVHFDAGELARLIEAVVVPETWFFRDVEPFRFVQRLARRHEGGPFRALSFPCSTGEEPYSLAMALLDAGMPAAQISVDAMDVSEAALGRAREGRYRANSFRGPEPVERARYFEDAAGTWVVRPEVKRLVNFRSANLLDPGVAAAGASYQLICCRNVLIYFLPEAKRLALTHLDRLLLPGGKLIVGHADLIESIDGRFRGVGEPGTFAYQRQEAGRERMTPVSMPVARERHTPVSMPVVSKPPRSPSPTSAPEPPRPPSPLEEAQRLADRGQLAEAAQLCEERLGCGAADPALYALLGVIRVSQSRPDDAERAFERALYLDRNHYAALVQLALLRDRRGDRQSAAQLRLRAERAVRRQESV